MARIFIGYSYHPRDRWVEDLVFDLARAVGFEPVSGREVYGEELGEAIKQAIRTCDALLGFTTRRDDPQGHYEGTHRWVTDELAIALASDIPVVEVREKGVSQGGAAGGRQHIPYEKRTREQCLVEVAKALAHLRGRLPVRVKLVPDELVEQEIAPHLRQPGFRCTYRLLKGADESDPIEARVRPIKGGLFALLEAGDPQALVSVSVEFGGRSWSSAYESIETPAAELKG